MSKPISELCRASNLLEADGDGMLRIPFLIKGQLRLPEAVSRKAVEAAFAEADSKAGKIAGSSTYVRMGNVQVLREPVIDRTTMQPTGEYVYSLMPDFDSREVMETDTTALARELYNMPYDGVLEFADAIRSALADEAAFIDQIRQTTRKTAEMPDMWHDAGFAAFDMLLDRNEIQKMVDQELSAWQIPGSRLLDEWVALPEAAVMPAPVCFAVNDVFKNDNYEWTPREPVLRAMPTRQLHITAGNSPQIPFLSAVRAIATKSAAVIKSPYGATLPGALLALAACAAAPDHLMTRHLSIVYWQGGDRRIENVFFSPGGFDRIIVWGAPDAVRSVKERASFTKVITLNPRYGASCIGREALEGDMNELAARVINDALVANQKACIASLVLYMAADDAAIRNSPGFFRWHWHGWTHTHPIIFRRGPAGSSSA